MRRAARKDQNQKEIEQTLTAAGVLWIDTSRLGSGFPDLVVLANNNAWHLLEVKIVGEALTPAEKIFHDRFMGAPLHVVYSGDHALFCIGAIDSYDDPIVKRKQPRQGTSAPRSTRQSKKARDGTSKQQKAAQRATTAKGQ